MLNISLMQCCFFKCLLGFLYNLAGFQSNIKEVQEKLPEKFSMFLRAKHQILRVLKLPYDVNKILNFCVCQCGKLDFFSMEKVFCLETVSNCNYYISLSCPS